MAINQNHLFDDLDGVKCSIVEKNCKPERVAFLKRLLEYNRYAVVVVASPPAKAGAAALPADAPAPPPPPETFTVGVTDLTFNPTNAVFGRILHAPGGHIVTIAYWQQKDAISHDDIPYFEKKKS